jgi:hypothetical protein
MSGAAGRSANGGRKARGPGSGASGGMQARTRPYWLVKHPGQREQFAFSSGHSDRGLSISISIGIVLPVFRGPGASPRNV